MYRVALLVSCLCLLGGASVSAQLVPATCVQSLSLPVTTALNGVWYTAASSIENPPQCGMVLIEVNSANTSVMLTFTFSNASDYAVNQTVTVTSTLDPNNVNGGFQFQLGTHFGGKTMTMKLLSSSAAELLACGYTNSTNNASSFGTILTSQRDVSQQTLDSLESSASASYANFRNGTMTPIMQDSMCYTSAAAKFTPLLGALISLLCIALKVFH